MGHLVDDYVCLNCESKISMVSYKKHLMKALAPWKSWILYLCSPHLARPRAGILALFWNCWLWTVDCWLG